MDFRRRQLDIRRVISFPKTNVCFRTSSVSSSSAMRANWSACRPRTDARSHEVLDYVGLGEARYRKVESYSTGMKQRLKLAAAVVHDPKLLILDEPTNGMDPRGREDLLELARDLALNKGMSLLFSSHLLPDVESSDQIIVLGRGKLLTEGTFSSSSTVSAELEVRLKTDSRPFCDRLSGARMLVPKRAKTSWSWRSPRAARSNCFGRSPHRRKCKSAL